MPGKLFWKIQLLNLQFPFYCLVSCFSIHQQKKNCIQKNYLIVVSYFSPSALKSYDDSVILVCSPSKQPVLSGSFSLVSGKHTLTTVYLFIYYLFIHLFIQTVVFPQRSANCLSHLRCLDLSVSGSHKIRQSSLDCHCSSYPGLKRCYSYLKYEASDDRETREPFVVARLALPFASRLP